MGHPVFRTSSLPPMVESDSASPLDTSAFEEIEQLEARIIRHCTDQEAELKALRSRTLELRKVQLEQRRTDLARLELDLETEKLREREKEQARQIGQLMDELASARKELLGKQAAIDELAQKLEQAAGWQSAVHQRDQTIHELESELRNFREEKCALESRLLEKSKQMETLEASLESVREELRTGIANAAKEQLRLKTESRSLALQLKKAEQAAHEQSDSQKSLLQQLEAAQTHTQHLTQEISKRSAELDAKNSQFQSLAAQIEKQKSAIDQIGADQSREVRDALAREAKVRSEYERLNEELLRSDGDHRRSEEISAKKIAELQKNIAENQELLDQRESQYQELLDQNELKHQAALEQTELKHQAALEQSEVRHQAALSHSEGILLAELASVRGVCEQRDNEIKTLNGLIAELRLEISGLRNAEASLAAEMEQLRESEEAIAAKAATLLDELGQSRGIVAENNRIIIELRESHAAKDAEISAFRRQISAYEEAVYAWNDAEVQYASEIAALREGLSEKTTQIESQIRIEAELKTELQSLRAESSAILEDRNSLRLQAFNLQEQIDDLESARGTLAEALDSAQTRLAEARLKNDAEIQSLAQQIQQLQTELAKKNDAESRKLRQLDELESEWSSRNSMLQDTQKQVLAKELKLDDLRKQLEESEKRISEKSTQIDQRLAERSAQLEQRETQLQNYLTALNREKTELRRGFEILVSELRSAKTMHPLRDVLTVTEREISTLEVELKRTPTISADRPQLERCLQQMVQQRDFLKSVLMASFKSLDQQCEKIRELAQSGQLAALPPLPPRSPTR